jgi:antitoxin component YwqK of YwqJK toxin-antitoxin module
MSRLVQKLDTNNHLLEYYVDEKGLIEGKYRVWDSKEKKILLNESEYKDGWKTEIEKSWYSNGNLQKECYYKKGSLEGRYKTWNENGIPKEDYECKDNIVISVLTLNDEKGRDCMLKEGEIIAWKACKIYHERPYVDSDDDEYDSADEVVDSTFVFVKLLVPADAKRVTTKNSEGRYKGRVSKAKVVEIVDERGNKYDSATSFVFSGLPITYRVDATVLPSGFNSNPDDDCGEGINVHAHKDLCEVWMK